jgi:HlyD family secretion protein
MNKRRVAAVAVVVVVLAALVAAAGWQLRQEDTIAWPSWLDLSSSNDKAITGSGFIEGVEVALAAEVPGQVAAVEVAEGAEVKADDILVRLESQVLDAQRDQAVAAADQAEARLARLQAGAAPGERAALSAAVDQAQAALDGADRAVATAAAQPAAVPAAAERERLATAQREAARTALVLAQARLAAVQAGAGAAEVRAAEAGIRAAQARLAGVDAQRERLVLRSPLTGTVAAVNVRVGETASAGMPLVTVVREDPLDLRIYVPEADVGKIKLGDEATVKVDGLPDDEFSGKVVAIADAPEYTPRNVQTQDGRSELVFAVTVRLANRDGTLKPGMAGDATLEVK